MTDTRTPIFPWQSCHPKQKCCHALLRVSTIACASYTWRLCLYQKAVVKTVLQLILHLAEWQP